MTPNGLPFFSATSRPSDPGLVKLLPPDWESYFFFSFFSFLQPQFSRFCTKRPIGLQCFSVRVQGPARKKQRVVQTQGNNYNLFASQLAALHTRTCENWVI